MPEGRKYVCCGAFFEPVEKIHGRSYEYETGELQLFTCQKKRTMSGALKSPSHLSPTPDAWNSRPMLLFLLKEMGKIVLMISAMRFRAALGPEHNAAVTA